ncbi:MAG TPA: P-loop NTPase fold protein [Flavobacteriaceae bacterium]
MVNKNGFENFEELVQKVLNLEFDIGLLPNQNVNLGRNSFKFDLADVPKEYFVEILKNYESKNRGSFRDKINERFQSLQRARSNRNSKLIVVCAESLSDEDKQFFNRNLNAFGESKPILYDGIDIANLANKYNINFVRHVTVDLSGTSKGSSSVSGELTGKRKPKGPLPPPGLNDDGSELTSSVESNVKTVSMVEADSTAKELLSNEFLIEGLNNIYYGQELGNEILDYDIFILPKASYGGIGKNGIAHKVLQILGIDKTSIEFTETDLKKTKYKWVEKPVKDKTVLLGFVITRDQKNEPLDFTSSLLQCVSALKKQNYINELKSNQINIFIPLLGAGRAGMQPMASLRIVIKGVQLLRGIIPLVKFRINLPVNASDKDLEDYLKFLGNTLSGPPPPPDISEENHPETDEIIEDDKLDELIVPDKIPFHLDQVVNEDKLGREPVAKAFVDLIRNDIFTDKLNHSFMVHLQGEWGTGKSSFLNFIKKNLSSGVEKWIIVDYNAWQNQHIDPPWWTLIDQVYRKSKEQLEKQVNWRACFHLWRKEVLRRIWRYSGWEKITAFLVFLISILCIIYFGKDILNLFDQYSQGTDNGEKSFVTNISDILKLILTLFSIIGTLYALAKFITVPLFISSSKEAKSFVLRASDPMNSVKRHFSNLVDNINSKDKKRQLAIFIDDIDRCNKKYIVCLLEGIQTLFKEKRVLYIVAGDKNWITKSFANTYEEFTTEEVDKKHLGEFFLEKAFQLSFRMPNISEEVKQNYWNHILGLERKEEKPKAESISELTEENQKEIKERLSESKAELTNPNFMKKMEDDFNLTGDTVSNIVIEEKNKDTETIKHLLKDYHEYLDTNPRAIIRLANQYTMSRSILMVERAFFDEQKLFRWLAIEDLCPIVKSIIVNSPNMEALEVAINQMKDTNKQKKCVVLLHGNATIGKAITIEEIKTIKGL